MADLLRVSLIGTQPNGEKWSVNPCFALGDFGEPVTPAQANTVATALSNVAVPAGVLTTWGPSTRFTEVRVEARTNEGTLEVQGGAVKASPVVGSGSNIHPFQTSWVLSLRTDQVGARGRGRLYWPATGIGLDNDSYRPTSVQVGAAVGAYKTYLAGLLTAVRATFTTAGLVVWSRTGAVNYPVRTIQMGDILDVQRRRRDSLVENYSALTWP